MRNFLERRLPVICTAAIATVLFCSVISFSADYSDAAKAYRSGDYAAALDQYLVLAEAGDVRAQVNLGWMYSVGEGVTADKIKAMEWYRKAAEKNDATALFNLGYAFENGDGVRKDLVEAHKWYGKCAALGDETALAALERVRKEQSSLWSITISAKPDVVTGTQKPQLPEKTASKPPPVIDSGSQSAVSTPAGPNKVSSFPNLPSLPKIDNKTSLAAVPQAARRAETSRVMKIRSAAEAGDTKAQLALGWIYSAGKEVFADKKEAIKWYRMAAEKGEMQAQMALGWLYFSGNGVISSRSEAAFWYSKAAARGNSKAKEMLQRIRSGN